MTNTLEQNTQYELIIFDCDGTLTTTKSGETFRKTADDWIWLPGHCERVQQLRREGVKIAIASNQAGVAFPWSKFTEEEMQLEIERVAHDIWADYVGVCYSTPNPKALPQYHNPNDNRRKPGPGMLIEAMQWYSIFPDSTLMVGDREEDQKAAGAAGVDFMWADQFFQE